ncbi:esterase [candidate division KSB1 bacterium]|nr:esterase [candidate division KSB1 bacterium]
MLGQLTIHDFPSRCLEGNPLGDPCVRRVPVYLPEGYAANREWPLIVMLAGFTATGLSFLNFNAWQENMPERIERLIAQKRMPPAVVIFPDCFTRYGGSQYLNSSATGDYEDHLTGELVPWARATFRAGLTPEQTVVAGKSSGGYGAFVLAARHPDMFGWILMHSGDCYFEYGYLADFPNALNELCRRGGPAEFIKSIDDPRPKGKSWFSAIDKTGMAACYSPNPASPMGFDYPFDLDTGELRQDVWARWLVHDPVRMAERDDVITNLKQLRGIYIECGLADEFHLQWGARILVSRLRKAGLSVEHREFDDGHMNINYRYDESLSWWGAKRQT